MSDRFSDMLIGGTYPDELRAGNFVYPINCSFRSVLDVIIDIENGCSPENAAKKFWRIFPTDKNAAVSAMIAFIGEEYLPCSGKRQPFSFSRDARFIIGAFQECFGIDIVSEDMHWFRFCALFSSLGAECAFSRLIVCRTARFSSAADKLAARKILRKYGG